MRYTMSRDDLKEIIASVIKKMEASSPVAACGLFNADNVTTLYAIGEEDPTTKYAIREEDFCTDPTTLYGISEEDSSCYTPPPPSITST